MKNMYYVWGMIFGIFVGVGVVLIKRYCIKDRQKKELFDERQTLARLRGYKLGFFTMIIYDAIYAFYSILVEKAILDTYAAMVLGIILGAAVFAVYAIWKDAYAALDKGRKNFLIFFGACGLANLMNGIREMHEEMAATKGGNPQIYVISFFAAFLNGVVFLAFALKGLTRKEEEE